VANSVMEPVVAKPATISSVIPFLDLKAQFQGIREEVVAAVVKVLETQHFILGPEVNQLESEIAAYLDCRFAIGCASGSDALLLALMALGVGPGDEVITTPFTFVATAGSIARLGARPVFVDIDKETYNINQDEIAKAITPKTKAILPVHLYGLPADMDSIMQLATHNGIPVVEDAAQALGAICHDRKVGNIGTVNCFSFFPSKNLGCAGDGGIVTTNDASIADRIRLLRVHGSRRKYHAEILGVNSRLDALQAALLRVKLRHLETWTEQRRRNADLYRALFRECGLQTHLIPPFEPSGMRHAYNQFVIRVEERDRLRDFLSLRGISTEIYYPEPLHLQPAFGYLGYHAGDFPEAEAASNNVIALPIYPELTLQQQTEVVRAIANFYSTK
jgi:dTDP-4-amino-4,6-dideoxygalactose transaminase